MLTWAVVYAFKILKGSNGFWLFGAMAGDCYIAFCVASSIIGKWS
jgi:hypothetical protein